MFLDRSLLAMGNLLFLSGLILVIGASKTLAFFSRSNKLRGTICFFSGIFLVFFGFPLFGIFIELFGFMNLFGDFFPVVIAFLRKLPIIGPLLSAPGITHIVDRIAGTRFPV
ncbi:Golgi Transport [Coelomomyces lativittatus]|nr:Golgi Transport [Coelomomyces lativittatus]